jgi:hypothetical protein
MVPRVIWVAMSGETTNHELFVLGAFFESLWGLEPIRHVSLSLYSAPFGDSRHCYPYCKASKPQGAKHYFVAAPDT